MNVIRKVSQLGVSESLDFRIRKRIILANRVAICMVAVSLGFFISSVVMPISFVIITAIVIFLSGLIWIANLVEYTKVSRIIASLIPALAILGYSIISKINDPRGVDILHYATPRLAIIGSLVLPFAFFTAAEKRYLWGSVIIILLLGFGYDVIHKLLNIDNVAIGVYSTDYNVVYRDSAILAFVALAGAGFMFNIGHQFDQQAMDLLKEARAQTQRVKRSEESMKKTLNELESSRKKEDEHAWVNRGVAEQTAILQSIHTDDLFDRWLSSLIKYMSATQGGLFLAETNEDESTVLRMVSSYAYNRKKFDERVIDSSEGLIGQAYMEGNLIYLKQIPQQYINITSGLGDAPPRVLVVVPIKSTQGVEGVLELAAFKEFLPHQIDLLEKLSESLGAYIFNNKTNEKTRKLLEQSQKMSDDLRHQDEELRKNLDQLKAIQEAMKKKEVYYQRRIEALEKELAVYYQRMLEKQ
jgi:hypothetical protein